MTYSPKESYNLGRRGEMLAAQYIKEKGFFISAKNYKSAHGEIDIIAENRKFVVFVSFQFGRCFIDGPSHNGDIVNPTGRNQVGKQIEWSNYIDNGRHNNDEFLSVVVLVFAGYDVAYIVAHEQQLVFRACQSFSG